MKTITFEFEFWAHKGDHTITLKAIGGSRIACYERLSHEHPDMEIHYPACDHDPFTHSTHSTGTPPVR